MQTEIGIKKYSRKTLYFFNFILFLSTLIFLFIGSELTLRLLKIQSDNHLMQHPVLGWVHIPNKSGRSVTSEFSVTWQINSHGFIGHEYSFKKPNDIFRIAVIGDSVTEAFQVPAVDSYTQLLERKLNTSIVENKNGYEVLNFGTTTYGTVKEFFVFENMVMNYTPDLVILALFIGNDIEDNVSEVIDPNAQFTPYQKIKNSIKVFVRNHFTVVQFIREKKRKNTILAYFKNRGDTKQESEMPLQPLYAYEYSSYINKGLERTKEYIQRFKKEADEKNIRLLIALLPAKEQVHEELRAPDTEQLDYEKPNNLLRTFLIEQEIKYVDLLPFFQT